MERNQEIDNLLSVHNIEKIKESDYIIIEENMKRLNNLMLKKLSSYSKKDLMRKYNNLKLCCEGKSNPRIILFKNSLYINGLVNKKMQNLVTLWLKDKFAKYIGDLK